MSDLKALRERQPICITPKDKFEECFGLNALHDAANVSPDDYPYAAVVSNHGTSFNSRWTMFDTLITERSSYSGDPLFTVERHAAKCTTLLVYDHEFRLLRSREVPRDLFGEEVKRYCDDFKNFKLNDEGVISHDAINWLHTSRRERNTILNGKQALHINELERQKLNRHDRNLPTTSVAVYHEFKKYYIVSITNSFNTIFLDSDKSFVDLNRFMDTYAFRYIKSSADYKRCATLNRLCERHRAKVEPIYEESDQGTYLMYHAVFLKSISAYNDFYYHALEDYGYDVLGIRTTNDQTDLGKVYSKLTNFIGGDEDSEIRMIINRDTLVERPFISISIENTDEGRKFYQALHEKDHIIEHGTVQSLSNRITKIVVEPVVLNKIKLSPKYRKNIHSVVVCPYD